MVPLAPLKMLKVGSPLDGNAVRTIWVEHIMWIITRGPPAGNALQAPALLRHRGLNERLLLRLNAKGIKTEPFLKTAQEPILQA